MTFTIAEVKSPPLRVGVLVGDIVHNLRSALDQVAWQLARLSKPKKSPPRGTYFPICATQKTSDSKTTQDKQRGINARYVKVIRSVQPFASGAHGPLLLLSTLSIRDKHRVINVVAVAAEGPTMRLRPTADSRPRHDVPWETALVAGLPLYVGQEVLRVPIQLKGTRSILDLELQTDFFAGLLTGENIGELLDDMLVLVEEVLVDANHLFENSTGRSLGSGAEENLPPAKPVHQQMVISALDSRGQVVATASGALLQDT